MPRPATDRAENHRYVGPEAAEDGGDQPPMRGAPGCSRPQPVDPPYQNVAAPERMRAQQGLPPAVLLIFSLNLIAEHSTRASGPQREEMHSAPGPCLNGALPISPKSATADPPPDVAVFSARWKGASGPMCDCQAAGSLPSPPRTMAAAKCFTRRRAPRSCELVWGGCSMRPSVVSVVSAVILA